MFFELYLGIRYLKAKRKQAFISVITVISVLGVMVGVMALIVVLSVMNGFREDLMSKILGVNSHLLILNYEGGFREYEAIIEKVDTIDGVIASTPFIYDQVMVNGPRNVAGAVLRGLDTQTVRAVVDIESMIKEGSLSSLQGGSQEDRPSIIVGRELAKQVGAKPGDMLTVVSPQGKVTPLGRVPASRKFRIIGLFESGYYEYDSHLVFIALHEAQDFLGIGDKVTGLEVKVTDIYEADRIGNAITRELGFPFWAKDWQAMNKSLVTALKLEKYTMFVILTMIVLVGALNIISTLVMVVMEKSRDVAILRAMGATSRSIMKIFMLQGLVVGLVGTLAGLFSGLAICRILEKYKFIELPADVYYISTLPVQVAPWDVLFVTVAAIAISFLATIYPSWHASRQSPVEALRYE